MSKTHYFPLVSKEEVHYLLPHRPPIVMVDLLLESTENIGTASLYIDRSNMFVIDGHLQESGLIEHMAQTLALKIADEGAKGQSDEKFMGYLVAVKNLSVYKLPAIGDEVITKATITKSFGNFSVAQFKSYVNGVLIAECGMRTMIEKKVQKKRA